MKPFVTHSGVAAPMLIDNIDTDQIIPSREMKKVSKLGLGEGLFAGWRYRYDDMQKTGLRENFVLNKPEYAETSILLGGRNFGCGSSREHAVWALYDYGIRAIIAESFGRIFLNNCARNGLLALTLPRRQIAELHDQTASDPKSRLLTIDLEHGYVESPSGEHFHFSIAESDRELLLEGLDHIDYTLKFSVNIDTYVSKDRTERPWAHLE